MAGPALRQWTRATPWRQGHVLDADATKVLGLSNSKDAAATTVIVVSHDCDLANDDLNVEPNVEVIVGRLVASPADGNFTWGKSPRTLHITMERDGVPVTVELVSTNKQQVSKQDLAQVDPEMAFSLDGKGLGVLRSWLGARYNRSAFPDAFVKRMETTKLDEKLAKALKPHGELISFVNFDIDSGKNIERQENDPYELSIVLVYPPGDDPDVAAEEADKAAEAIKKICEERLKAKTDIVLKRCIAISEDDIPISQARVLMQWSLEYMTHKADDHPGPVLK